MVSSFSMRHGTMTFAQRRPNPGCQAFVTMLCHALALVVTTQRASRYVGPKWGVPLYCWIVLFFGKSDL